MFVSLIPADVKMTSHPTGRTLNRRDALKTFATTGAVAGFAGCLSLSTDSGSSESGSDHEGDGTPTEPEWPDHPVTGPPELVDLDERGGEVSLKTIHARHEVHPSDNVGGPLVFPEVWAWAADDGVPSVPAPVLRATEGQELEITLDNTESTKPHTLHFHGVRVNWEDDGTGETSGITVGPGDTHTYTIPANVPGTHIYHCHYNTPTHMDMGMYGILRIDPEGYEPADVEEFWTVREWDSRLSEMWAGGDRFSMRDRDADVFTINGRSAPTTLNPELGSPLIVGAGDTIRVHLVNAGYEPHAIHPHNHRFKIVEHDGSNIPEAMHYLRDVITVGPAERYTIEFEADADPGIYPFHCHVVDHVMNGDSYPGGMLSAIVYEEAMTDDIFAGLMEHAGHDMDDH